MCERLPISLRQDVKWNEIRLYFKSLRGTANDKPCAAHVHRNPDFAQLPSNPKYTKHCSYSGDHIKLNLLVGEGGSSFNE